MTPRNPQLYRNVVRWEDLPEEEVRKGVRRRSYASDEVMLVMNWLSPGMDLSPHKHDEFDQLAWVVSGRANYYVDDVPHEMTAGSMLLVPAGAMHYIEPLGESPDDVVENLDVFVPPRSDLLHLVASLSGAAGDDGRTP
ncbi:MAG: cupin domain-containing protein [Nocardioidaceae bacterium]